MTESTPVVDELVAQGVVNAPDSAKGRLLRTAAHLFVKNGFERTTVRELASEMGIQSGSLFYHYPNKEAILKAVLMDTIHINTARMEKAIVDEGSAEERLLVLIRCEIESILGDTGEAMSLLLSEWRSLTEESQQDILQLRDRYESLWLKSLEGCQQEGLIEVQPEILRQFLRGSISWVKVWYDPEGQVDLDSLCRMALKLAVK